MDYEKKYKNALTIAQSRFKIEKDESVLTCLGMMFPELRENDDERIRKAFICGLKNDIAEHRYETIYGIKLREALAWFEKQKEQKPVEKPSKEECITKFKALCDAYDIKLPNREYDIYGLCEDLHKFFGDIQKPAEWSEEEEQMFGNILNHYSLIEAPTDGNGISKERYLAFIKSLRPSWKPSEEQMEALKECGECKRCIKELREQLEKQ